MSFNFSTGTKTVERIIRLAYGNFTIGTSMQDSLGTADIRQFTEDGERYILGKLESTVSSIPSPAPNSLSFSADYLGAYFAYTTAFAANKPGEVSDVVKSWKEMADSLIKSYVAGYSSGDANIAGYTTATAIFKTRGVQGIGDGILEDSKDIKTHHKK